MMSAQAWCLLLFVATAVSGVLGALLALRYGRYKAKKLELREAERDEALAYHRLLAEVHGRHVEQRTGVRVYPYGKDAPVKAEPLYDDDEDSEPFDISLQVYGDVDEGRSAASLISCALTQWLRAGAKTGGYTASNGLRVHLVQRGVRTLRFGEEGGDE